MAGQNHLCSDCFICTHKKYHLPSVTSHYTQNGDSTGKKEMVV